MKLLLDTHVFLWYITEDSRLSDSFADAIRQKSNDVFLSVVSVWEILVKHQLGKLPLPSPPDEYIRDRREKRQLSSLGLDETSVGYLLRLPLHHRDPFDRMLICQALHHDLSILSVDHEFARYPIKLLHSS